MLTTKTAVRAAFWAAHPHLSRTRIRAYSGTGTMFKTDTRVAFVDWLDSEHRAGNIKESVAQTVTLSRTGD